MKSPPTPRFITDAERVNDLIRSVTPETSLAVARQLHEEFGLPATVAWQLVEGAITAKDKGHV